MKGIFRKDLYFIMQNQKAFLLCIGIFTVSWVLQAVHDTDSTLMSAVIFLYGAMLPHILLSLVMGGAVLSVQLLELPDPVTLLIGIPVGIVLYVGGAKLLKLESFDFAVSVIRSLLARRKKGE